MRRCLMAILVVGLVSLTSRDAAAQPSDKDLAAYAALNLTPVGALTPIVISPGTKGEKSFSSFAGRFSHFSEDGSDGSNSFGASYYMPAGSNAAISGTLGYLKDANPGGEGMILAGADLHSTLWNNASSASSSAMSVNLQGSLGYGHHADFNAMSGAIGFPLALSITQASKSKVGFFVTPGFGFGRMSADVLGTTVSESGTRPMVAAGASWVAAAGWGLHASFNKVILENGGNNIGIGFSYKMGK